MLDRIKRVLDGGRGELSRDNLVQRVVERVCDLRDFGRRGQIALPAEVAVEVAAPPERLELARTFVLDPSFDEDVDAELANRLPTLAADAFPLRSYTWTEARSLEVYAAGRNGEIHVTLVVSGGDRDGQHHHIPSNLTQLRLGRGPFHGPDQRERNDIVLSDNDAFVSRRAARLRRFRSTWELQALDQAACLAVVRADGVRVRPHHTPERWVALRAGDGFELNDGAEQYIFVAIGVGPPL